MSRKFAVRRFSVGLLVSALLVTLSSCVDSRTSPPPPPVKASLRDMYGTWKGWAGSSLTLRPDATASVVKLDGQEFDFDDGWRMTGKGTWTLKEPGTYRGGNTVGNGSVVQLSISSEVGAADASAAPGSGSTEANAASRTASPPEKAVWDLGVMKGEGGEMRLFFLTSDPDVRDTYYLVKGK